MNIQAILGTPALWCGRWTLQIDPLYEEDVNQWELFDLKTDPHELKAYMEPQNMQWFKTGLPGNWLCIGKN